MIPEKLQQLVDGELSAIEVRECLQHVDEDSTQWRSIACAFVEDQMFRKQFGEYVDQPDSITSTQSVPMAETRSRSSRSVLSSLVLAASVLLVGMVGYLIGSKGGLNLSAGPATNSNQIAQRPDPVIEKPVQEKPAQEILQPEYRVELLSAAGESLGSEVDLYEYGDLNRLVGNDVSEPLTVERMLPPSGVSADLRQRMARSGYEVNETTNYMSGHLDDGRAFVVPVRSIRFDRGH